MTTAAPSAFHEPQNEIGPNPFIKWSGGKRQLVPRLLEHVPPSFGTYHECFVGGGALFFALQPKRAIISDANLRLIRTYRAIRDDVGAVIARLEVCRRLHSKAFFHEVRASDIDAAHGDSQVAAWLIYLNKTCFNGLFRVNKSGQFNVPFGKYMNPCILDEARLRACSKALQGVDIQHRDFRIAANHMATGDLAYFDPPYIPISATSSFTSYTADGFGAKEQIALRDMALTLKRRGVHVLLSNSVAARPLYEKDFEIVEVFRRGTVSSKGSGRQPVPELIIR